MTKVILFSLQVATFFQLSCYVNALSPDRFYLRVANDTERTVEVSVLFNSGLDFLGSVADVSVRDRGGSEFGVRFRKWDEIATLAPGARAILLHWSTELRATTLLSSFIPGVVSEIALRSGEESFVVAGASIGTLAVCFEPLSPTTANYVISVDDLIRISGDPMDDGNSGR